MKNLLIAGVMVLGLAACGGSGGDAKSKLVKACLDEGGTAEAECNCMADAAVENLDADLLGKMVQAAESGSDSDAAMNEIMGDLTPEQMGQFMAFAMEAGTTCGLEG